MDDCRNLEEVKDVEFVISYEELFFFVEDDDGIKFIVVDEGREILSVEEKFRVDIDEILEGNLDFWMRFSIFFG